MWKSCHVCVISVHLRRGFRQHDKIRHSQTKSPSQGMDHSGRHSLHCQCHKQLGPRLQDLHAALYDFQIGKSKTKIPTSIVKTLTFFFKGSLVASLLTGMYVLGKRHTKSKYLSVILVTIGIFICTLASGKEVSKDQGASSLSDWFIGIFLLTASLILSARMGVYQEQIYTKWGKHHKEALFYTVSK